MAITPLNENLNIISALPDEPTEIGGMTNAQLKAKWDEAGNKIKTYINGTLIPDIGADTDTKINDAVTQSGSIPLGGISGQMLTKNSDANYDYGWQTYIPSTIGHIPTGGTTGQVLRKYSDANYDCSWQAISGVSAATPNTLMQRDANGRAQVAAPAASGDIVTKGYADNLTKVGDIKQTARIDLGSNWLLCNGEILNPSYTDLFAVLPYSNNTITDSVLFGSNFVNQVAGGLGLTIYAGYSNNGTYNRPTLWVVQSGGSLKAPTAVYPLGAPSQNTNVCGICFDGTRFACVLNDTPYIFKVYTSVDGITWTFQTSITSMFNDVNTKIFYVNGKYIITLNMSGSGYITSSDVPNGPWTSPVSLSVNDYPASLAYGNSEWVISGINRNLCYASSLGGPWTTATYDANYSRSIIFANGYFLCGKKYSTNGVSWADITAFSALSGPPAIMYDTITNFYFAYYNNTVYYTTTPTGTWSSFQITGFTAPDIIQRAGNNIFGGSLNGGASAMFYVTKALRAKFLPLLSAATHYTYIKAWGE